MMFLSWYVNFKFNENRNSNWLIIQLFLAKTLYLFAAKNNTRLFKRLTNVHIFNQHVKLPQNYLPSRNRYAATLRRLCGQQRELDVSALSSHLLRSFRQRPHDRASRSTAGTPAHAQLRRLIRLVLWLRGVRWQCGPVQVQKPGASRQVRLGHAVVVRRRHDAQSVLSNVGVAFCGSLCPGVGSYEQVRWKGFMIIWFIYDEQ